MNISDILKSNNLEALFSNEIVKTLATILISFLIYYILIKYTKKALVKSKIDSNFHTFIISLSKTLITTILILINMSTIFKINISTFLAAFSVAGLALSLAVKDSLSNVASGVLILVSKPFENGHFIEIEGYQGTVIDVNLIYTKLTTIDNKIIFIPNNEIAKSVIINYNKQKKRMLELIFQISYNDDIEKSKNLLLDVCKKSKFYLENPTPNVMVESLQSNGINIMLRCWCKTDDYLNYKFYLNEEVKKCFDENNITFPFSQHQIYISK